MKRFAALPLLCFGLLFACACYAAVVVGHWPYYSHPDPKDLPSAFPAVFGQFTVLIGVFSMIIIPVLYGSWRLIMRVKRWEFGPHGGWIALYAAGALVWILDLLSMETINVWPSLVGWILD